MSDNSKTVFPNMDLETGIHYGVVHQNKLSSYAIDDIIMNGDDAIYDNAKAEFEQRIRDAISEVLDDEYVDNSEDLAKQIDVDTLIDAWNESYQNDCHHYVYSDGEFKLEMDDYGDIFVIKSPFITYCKACSPCAINAGYLTDSVTKEEYEKDKDNHTGLCTFYHGLKKAYCLPDDWFEGGKAPYEYFEVEKNDIISN